MKDEYKRDIELMVSNYELYGEMPNIYSDEFQRIVCHKLMREENGMHYTHYRFLPLFEREYQFPELLKLVCSYIKSEGDPDIEKKISKEIAETLVKNSTFYFREEIEDEIEREHRNKYNIPSLGSNFGHTDFVES